MSEVRANSTRPKTSRTETERVCAWLESLGKSIPEAFDKAFPGIVFAQPYSGPLQGLHNIRVIDFSGRRRLHGVLSEWEDAQTLDAPEPTLPHEAPPVAPGEEPPDREAVVRDNEASVEERANALREWMTGDLEAASTFIAEELCRTDLPNGWRDALVFAAEDAHFATRHLQQRVCGALRQIALELRTSSRPGIEEVVWSALRRFGSLVERHAVDEFREFLNPAGYVDTRLVVLKSVVRLFEREPPNTPDSLAELSDRTFDIAAKLLDPDVFISGETSAIATQAVLVLCVLADRRALECAKLAKALGRRWVVRKLRERLQAIRAAWAEESHDVEQHASYALVQQVLSDLE